MFIMREIYEMTYLVVIALSVFCIVGWILAVRSSFIVKQEKKFDLNIDRLKNIKVTRKILIKRLKVVERKLSNKALTYLPHSRLKNKKIRIGHFMFICSCAHGDFWNRYYWEFVLCHSNKCLNLNDLNDSDSVDLLNLIPEFELELNKNIEQYLSMAEKTLGKING